MNYLIDSTPEYMIKNIVSQDIIKYVLDILGDDSYEILEIKTIFTSIAVDIFLDYLKEVLDAKRLPMRYKTTVKYLLEHLFMDALHYKLDIIKDRPTIAKEDRLNNILDYIIEDAVDSIGYELPTEISNRIRKLLSEIYYSEEYDDYTTKIANYVMTKGKSPNNQYDLNNLYLLTTSVKLLENNKLKLHTRLAIS